MTPNDPPQTLGFWGSLARWILRRPPPVEPGAEAFGYASPMTAFIWAMVVLSFVEIPAVHLILPWRWAKLLALPLGVYGVVAMLGMLATLRMNPHLVGPLGLRLRQGSAYDVTVPWDSVQEIHHRLHAVPEGRGIQVQAGESGSTLHIGVSKQTNVRIAMRAPTALDVRRGHRDPIDEVRFWVDDPAALVETARRRLLERNG